MKRILYGLAFLLFLNACTNDFMPEYPSLSQQCEFTRTGVLSLLRNNDESNCIGKNGSYFCDNGHVKLCDKKRYKLKKNINYPMCARSIVYGLFPDDYDCSNKKCIQIISRDYEKIIQKDDLELMTPYCRLQFAVTKREECIALNELFIERLKFQGKEKADSEIEKHNVVFKDINDNYCIKKYKISEVIPENSGPMDCFDWKNATFEELKKYVGKKIDCRN